MRLTIAAGAVVFLTACGRDSVTTPAPTPNPASAPQGFVLGGQVFDTASRPVNQARIEAMDGPQAGAVTTSDAQGQFSFSQTFTQGLTLRASKDGYVTGQQSVIPQGNLNSPFFVSFLLASPTPPINLEGNYLVTLTADAACTNLPVNTVSRSYTSTVNRTSRDTVYVGRLAGATFATGPDSPYDSFAIAVSGTFVHFFFWSYANEGDNPANGLVEQWVPEAYLGIGGEAAATVEDDLIDLPVSGFFAYCPGPRANVSRFVCMATPIKCESKNHRLRLTRR